MAHRSKGATRWLCACGLALGAVGCGGTDGARYTIDADVSFDRAGGSDGTITLTLMSFWSSDASFEFTPLGGDSSESLSIPGIPIDSWRSTTDPYLYEFTQTVEVLQPDDAEAPRSAALELVRASDGARSWAIISSHVARDEEDGWIPVAVAASFEFGIDY